MFGDGLASVSPLVFIVAALSMPRRDTVTPQSVSQSVQRQSKRSGGLVCNGVRAHSALLSSPLHDASVREWKATDEAVRKVE